MGYTLYAHINKINYKVYIGITCQYPPTLRWGTNGSNYKNSPRFWAAIQKYGWDGFYHIILKENLSKKEACEEEKRFIKKYNSQDSNFGYNILEGGQASIIPKEVRQKMSKAMLGNKNGKGVPCSKEKAKKISEAQKGRKLTQEHKDKLSLAKKGKTHAPPSEKTRQKISDSHDKLQVFCPETQKVYPSIQECAREFGIDATAICAVCKGRHKTTHGYHFQYFHVLNA